MSTGQARRCGSPRSCPGIAHYSMPLRRAILICRLRGWLGSLPDAVKATHKSIRDVCKTVVLGANYGMGAEALAYRTGLSKIEAQELLRRLAITFPVFTSWAQHVIDVALLTGQLSTVFGSTIRITAASRPTTLRNYPMQANGAEMLRMACCLATERGINVCAPVHDALLVEGAAGDLRRGGRGPCRNG